MIRYYCDACGEEHKHLHTFQIPCHLFSKAGEIGYVDSNGNHVSGRMDSVGLCNRCLNRVYSKAVSEFKKISEETEKPKPEPPPSRLLKEHKAVSEFKKISEETEKPKPKPEPPPGRLLRDTI